MPHRGHSMARVAGEIGARGVRLHPSVAGLDAKNNYSRQPQRPACRVSPATLPTRRQLSEIEFISRAPRAISARHHDYDLRSGFCDLIHRRAKRWLARTSYYVLASCLHDHFRYPMPSDVERIHPFEAQDARPRSGCNFHLNCGDPLRESDCQP